MERKKNERLINQNVFINTPDYIRQSNIIGKTAVKQIIILPDEA